MNDVIVIGAGIAGLTAAYRLRRQGWDVLVLEEKSVPGGNIRTLEVGGFRVETGPHSFMGSSEHVWRLVQELDLSEEVEEAAKVGEKRYVLRDSTLHPLPLSPWSFLTTRLLSFKGRMRMAAEPFVKGGARENETAWEFFRRRFGEEAARYIMSPFISGIYAGDIHTLGARAAFPKFWRFEFESGSMVRGAIKYMRAKKKRLKAEGLEVKSGMFSFRGGLGKLTRKLAETLDGLIECEVSVDSVTAGSQGLMVRAQGREYAARQVVLAVPPGRASAIVRGAARQAADLLDSIPMVPVTLVHWSLPEGIALPRGFGFLVPRSEGVRLLGTLFPSQLFSLRSPAGKQLMATFYGGALDPAAASLSDGEIADLVKLEHEKILGAKLEGMEVVAILRSPTAIPQLLPDHPEKIELIKAELGSTLPGLVLAGNYLTGVGMEHAAESGFSAAAELLSLTGRS